MVYSEFITAKGIVRHDVKLHGDYWFIDPYNIMLAIATNMPALLQTGFVVHGYK